MATRIAQARQDRIVVDARVGDNSQNARPTIQAALNAAKTAGGGHVYVPPGTYLLAGGVTTGENLGGLLIASNTRLELHPLATIKRANNSDGLLRTDSNGFGLVNDTGPGGYTGTSNVEIFGGTWDGNQANFPTVHNIITSVHGENWNVHDCTLKNCYGFHFLEFNSTRNARASRITFLDLDPTTTSKEMLQVDNALTPVRGGLADATPCTDVLVQGCTFRNGSRGVGSHSSGAHTNIRVIGNHIETMRNEGIAGIDWNDSVISNNTLRDIGLDAIKVYSTANVVKGVVISNNILEQPSAHSAAMGIHVDGNDGTNYRCQDVTITGNIVRGLNTTGGSWGLQVRFCRNVEITGNHILGYSQSGILVFKSQLVGVTGNSVHGNNTTAAATHADITTTGSTTTDLQDVVLSGNHCDTLFIGPFGNRIMIVGNLIATSSTTTGTNVPTGINRVANFVAGTWVP